ncbi:MAG TPA: hypothetical protein VFW97_12215 [Acidimicrobiia bacterium]|jgi:hypothetical protein|nr:hypothetical protein [Acidimicrobiia bacterium]
MTGSQSERLTLFDFDSAEDLAATDTMSMPVLTDPEVGMEPLVEGGRANRDAWAEGAAAHP